MYWKGPVSYTKEQMEKYACAVGVLNSFQGLTTRGGGKYDECIIINGKFLYMNINEIMIKKSWEIERKARIFFN